MTLAFGAPNAFWAKLKSHQGAGPPVWHPLVHHCADVGAVAEALLTQPTWRTRLERLAVESMETRQWSRLSVLATLHDIGKLNIGFQAKGRPELGTKAGHVAEAVAAVTKPVFAALARLNAWGDATGELLVAALCHHGRPHAYAEAAACWQVAWWQPRLDLDPVKGLGDLLGHCEEWFPDAFAEGGPPLPVSAAFGHAFAGVVMLADWIASDERFFPLSSGSVHDRMPFARSQAHKLARHVNHDALGDQARQPKPGPVPPRRARGICTVSRSIGRGSIAR